MVATKAVLTALPALKAQASGPVAIPNEDSTVLWSDMSATYDIIEASLFNVVFLRGCLTDPESGFGV